jgi:HAD superfamily hydrolase (TIGR01509 family)
VSESRRVPLVRAVIFDCDGVLIDSEVLLSEAELAVLVEEGLVFDPLEYKRRFLGLSYRDALAGLEAEAQRRLGRSLSADFGERVGRRAKRLFDEKLRPIAGAAEALGRIRWPKAVASSTSLASLSWKLAKTGLLEPFDGHVYSSDQVARGKPAPDLFLFAAERIGADPSTTIVVEDSANGVRAAKAAGMTALGFVGGAHCAADHEAWLLAAGADGVVGSFAALERMLLVGDGSGP